jgi:hypothetical protein
MFIWLMILSFGIGAHFGRTENVEQGMAFGLNAGNCMHVKEWKEYLSDKDTYTVITHKCE